ncbi:hypothetical protein [Staphylococcus epidermidis]|nr:hypothetical protein [Staphylococcus epidermidis]
MSDTIQVIFVMVKMLLGTFNMIINVDSCYLDILLHRIFYRYNIKDIAL